MLRKLLKYEIKATARVFLPLYLILFTMAIVNKLISLIFPLGIETPKVVGMAIYSAILVGMFVATFVMILQRFYKNLLANEGYLMFTLPTVSWKLICSKLLVAVLWTTASGLAACMSIFIIVLGKDELATLLVNLKRLLLSLVSYFGLGVPLLLLEISLAGFLALAGGILLIYAAMALGHLTHRHRIIASVVAFIGLYTISLVLFWHGIRIIAAAMPHTIHNFFSWAAQNLGVKYNLHLGLWFIIAITGLSAAAYFAITNYILTNRLNLE